jgi:beta-lactamase class D
MRRIVIVVALLASSGSWAPARVREPQAPPTTPSSESCFLLFELGVGEVQREPAEGCRTRVTPASTFKIPHAIAALDSGVINRSNEMLRYDGSGQWPESARRNHTLASALQNSVVWYFQRVAERLGAAREQAYLQRLAYGNMDPSSGLTTFWIGGSLLVTAEEQQSFLVKFYEDRLPVGPSAARAVREMLVQPRDVVVNAAGHHPFNARWPAGTAVSAKTGSATDASGLGVRWLVGHISQRRRSFVFVSCVIGPSDLQANAAIDLAARALRDARVM